MVKRGQRQIAFFAASIRAMYLAFVNNSATVSFLFEHQLTRPLFTMKIKLDVDVRLSLSPAPSESEYLSINSFSFLPYVIF